MVTYVKLRHLVASAVLAIASAGCSGSDSPAGPAEPPTAPTPRSVRISPPFMTLTTFGERRQATARVRDQRGSEIRGLSILWESADPGVATVDSSGEIEARGNGRTSVFARFGDVGGTMRVVVSQVAVEFALARDSLVLPWSGAELVLQVTGLDAGGSPLTPGANVAWTSLDEGVAEVSSLGIVTASREGATSVFAQSGTGLDTLFVRVSSSEPGRPEIFLVSPLEVTAGDTLRITGERFASAPDLNEVLVDGVEAEVLTATSTEVTAVVPPNGGCRAARFVPVILTAFGEEARAQVRLVPPAGCS